MIVILWITIFVLLIFVTKIFLWPLQIHGLDMATTSGTSIYTLKNHCLKMKPGYTAAEFHWITFSKTPAFLFLIHIVTTIIVKFDTKSLSIYGQVFSFKYRKFIRTCYLSLLIIHRIGAQVPRDLWLLKNVVYPIWLLPLVLTPWRQYQQPVVKFNFALGLSWAVTCNMIQAVPVVNYQCWQFWI